VVSSFANIFQKVYIIIKKRTGMIYMYGVMVLLDHLFGILKKVSIFKPDIEHISFGTHPFDYKSGFY
jgi:hypothetical protein